MYKNSTEMTYIRKEFYLGYSFISILKNSLAMTKLLLLNLFMTLFFLSVLTATVSCWRKNTTWVFIWCMRSYFFLCSASEDMIVTCSGEPAVSSNEVQRIKTETQSQVKDCKCCLFQMLSYIKGEQWLTDIVYIMELLHPICICTAKSGITTGPC